MTRGAVLMVQGTASTAGKSLLVAGLCRLFVQEGVRVAPFKSQNMSNNAFVTAEGHEIGRAQALQARAARLLPHVDMNPVLLKPEADTQSQVIVMGKPLATLHAAAYQEAKERIWGDVTAALARLRAQYDLVVIEGAGGPAEINLKARDISNMRVALHAGAPVIIVGDIDRGGVFAHLYGTYHLLGPEEQALVKGFVINKLRGDPSLLGPGLSDIERLTTVPVLGVVPWVRDLRLPEEDGVALDRREQAMGPFAGVDVAVVQFPRIANFDDFDPLEAEADVRVRYVRRVDEFGAPDLVILPGTKSTIADLGWLRESGVAAQVLAAAAAGVPVLGICGGLQVLGAEILDEAGVESRDATRAQGLGLLPVVTRFEGEKQTAQVVAKLSGGPGLLAGTEGLDVSGYEIHAGRSGGGRAVMAGQDGAVLGVCDQRGLVVGSYLHGLLDAPEFRRRFLANVASLRGKRYVPSPPSDAEASLDRLADVLRSALDLPAIFRLCGVPWAG